MTLCAALICLACVLVYLVKIECQSAQVPFYLEYQSGSGVERYACWRGNNRQCYIFLPGYADISQARVVMNTSDEIFVNGERLDENTDCSAFAEDCVYQMTYCGLWETEQLELMFMRSGEVAVVHIDTESGNMDYIHAQKDNEEKAEIRIYSADGSLTCTETLKSIAARGNSTFDEEKKPYIIKFTQAQNVLEMGAAEKWVLLANAMDLTNLRNELVLDAARGLGLAYTPDTQYVELYLNGQYVGLYLLSEKIEVNETSVNIPLEGSYLFSLEDRGRIITQNLPRYETEAGQVVRIRHPEVLNEAVVETVGAIVQRAENAILSEGGYDPQTGAAWDNVIDVDSWARKYLIEEVFANLDAGKWSQYFYVEKNGQKIHAGPVWDYDLSLAISWKTALPNAWYCSRRLPSGEPIAPWFDALSRKPAFMQRVVEIYETELLPILTELIDGGIRQLEQTVTRSSQMNAVRWSGLEKEEGRVERIEAYLRERIQFLNDVWIVGNEYVDVMAYAGGTDGYLKLSFAVGATLDSLRQLPADNFYGWYHSADGSPVEPEQTAEVDMQIYAQCAQKAELSSRMIELIPLGLIWLLGVAILIAALRRLKKAG